MNKEYKVKLNLEKEGVAYLLVTHNGHQWASIRIYDLVIEIPLIISELQRYLESVTKDDVSIIEKTRFLERELNNILPGGNDNMFGTDGSHEGLMDVFEEAWVRTDTIAREAIRLLTDEKPRAVPLDVIEKCKASGFTKQ